MGKARTQARTTSPAKVWVRRCRACGADDLSAAFGQASMLTDPWSCPGCRSGWFEPVQVPSPSVDDLPVCPHLGAA